MDFFKEGEDGLYERFSEEFSETAFLIDDIKKILSECGFKLLNVYDENFSKALNYDCERLIFAVEKE